jgi:hypothetical protein
MTSELVRGTARSMGYQEFSKRLRQGLPVKWYRGKLKWWWLRLTHPRHPAFVGRADWIRAAARAAGKEQLSAVGWFISVALSACETGLWIL